jgi:asparagine synthase (glutamine-hydrolysing)
MADLSSQPVNTCSIGFHQPGYDESRFAAEVAERYGTNHHVQQVDADSLDLVEKLASIYDEPFADSSAIPTYRVCALARERVTVALSGDGGDELFAGYRRYRWFDDEEKVRRWVPSRIRSPLFGLLARLYPELAGGPKLLRAKATLRGIARDSDASYFNIVAVLNDDLRRRLFSSTMRRELQGYRAIDVIRGHMSHAPAEDHLGRVQYADLKTYLSGDILTKVDRASMANSLEVRVPLLDHALVEWAAGLPPGLKLKGREGKYLFKKALQPYLPRNLLYRQKMGFAVPLGTWFRGPLQHQVREALCGQTLAETGMFDMAAITQLLDQHVAGEQDHSAALWALVMFGTFLRDVHARPPSTAEERPQPVRA